MQVALYHANLIQISDARRGHKYLCPFCHRIVIVHQLSDGHRHFVHYHSNANCGGESSEHLMGKIQIARFFYVRFHNVKVEKYLSLIHQWPDILVNDSTVIEFQCSPISSKVLTARINGYLKVNLKSWWILGSPYYYRKLGIKYLARFMRYSPAIGFYLAFWITKFQCLELRYQFREMSGKVFYRSKRIKTFRELCSFVHSYRLRTNHPKILLKADLRLLQRRLFHQDIDMIRLQLRLNRLDLTIDSCPLVCHKSPIGPPIFKKKMLLWRIWILLFLQSGRSLKMVYNQANRKLGFPLNFIQVRFIKQFYRQAFNHYVYRLVLNKYLVVQKGYVVSWQMPTWFKSFRDKQRSLEL